MSEFKGVITALATPFLNGELDDVSLARLVQHQMDNRVSGFVVNGTTGESPTLSVAEVKRIYDVVRTESGRSVPVIVGSGSNSTNNSVELTRLAEKWGADAALVVVPYYNRPPQRGLVHHFQKVAESAQLPIIIYNVPSRTITQIEVDSLKELAKISNIVGIKEASGDLRFLQQIKDIPGSSLALLSGDDATGIEFCMQGGQGIISVASHLIPGSMGKLIRMARQGEAAAVEQYKRFKDLLYWLYIEANPIPLKWALHYKGLIRSPEVRSPLMTLSPEYQEGLKKCLDQLAN